MLEWLIGHAISGLYSLLTKSVLKPMIWSGQQIRCAHESISAMDIRLHNAQVQTPGATPTDVFFQERRKQLWIIGLHTLFWVVVLTSTAILSNFSTGFGIALVMVIMVIVGYFNVSVSGMPSRIDRQGR